jgi:alpha-mannosidase
MSIDSETKLTINRAIERLRQLSQIDVQKNWFYSTQNLAALESIDFSNLKVAPLNHKGYITWSAGRQVQWLAQKFTIPYHLQNYPLNGLSLRLGLTWWAEFVQIFVDGKLVQEGDLFDSSTRILLTNSVTPQTEFFVAIRLISPGHDIGALMKSRCIYEKDNDIDPGFVADELTVLSQYLEAFAPEKLDFLAIKIAKIDWDVVADATAFNSFLNTLRQNLQPLAVNLKQRNFHLLGHAHLDMAWLWTTEETYDAAQRTFKSVLSLQQDFSDLTFCHTTPALYAWIEANCPDLFAAIGEAIDRRKWEVVGGMWIEPEVNLIGGESLVRQLLYGQRYNREKFGSIATIAWLPDSFGFPWQLPQILQQAGIEYFVTGKLHWNDTTKFPYGCFWWQSPDGTRIFTLMSPPNVAGVMDTNPVIMTNYAVDWEKQTGLTDALWLPGVGDRGGGPTRDMLQVQARWRTSPFFPNIQFTTARDYLTKISRSESRFPTWNDELYLEFHRGCYTTHAEQKKFNRYCEGLLYQAELFNSVAILLSEKSNRRTAQFPIIKENDTKNLDKSQEVKAKIDKAWKTVLFNQFHDILPGTSIREVFVQAEREWQEAISIGEEILAEALETIAASIDLTNAPNPEAKPIVIFNSLNWNRSEVVEISVPAGNWEIYNAEGKQIRAQLSANDRLLFVAEDIPSIGYRLFWLSEKEIRDSGFGIGENYPTDFTLENEILRVKIDPQTGDLSSVFVKDTQKEILAGAGNQLQAFQDSGQYWDAWNIDPNYRQHPLAPSELKSIEWIDRGEIRSTIRVVRQIGKSEFTQDYILDINSPILKIATTVDWQEERTLVKAAFPLNLEGDYATYEIACGAIERTTKPQTEAEKAKWEVYALRWADLSDNSQQYGVSLLNDCKYGYDSQPNRLSLTLLRSPRWPDPESDRGIHNFTYALYPHQNNWKSAKTVRRGYELNLPLLPVFPTQIQNPKSKISLPSVDSFLDLDSDNLILIAFKPAEDEAQTWILRCYECYGEKAEFKLQNRLGLEIDRQVNLLEEELESDRERNLSIEPWKIKSFKLN